VSNLTGMRRLALTLALPAVLLAGATQALAVSTPKPQVTDKGGDSLATKSQDIKSVLFQATGPAKSKALVVTMTTWSPVMTDLSEFNYEVDATTTCGTVSFSFSPGTPYQKVTGLNGWVSSTCGDYSDLVAAQVKDNTITWVLPLDAKHFKKGMVFTGFEARIDPANPAVPFPSSTTLTDLGLIDGASSNVAWRLP
jgi:hypothetical protein